MCSEMRLLSTPLPLIVPRFCALNAVASSLKYWMSVPGSGPPLRIFSLTSSIWRRRAMLVASLHQRLGAGAIGEPLLCRNEPCPDLLLVQAEAVDGAGYAQ